MMNTINYDAFVEMADEQIRVMSDAKLAESFTSAVVLNQRANIAKDMKVFRLGESAKQMQDKLQQEIDRREMEWVVPFYGRPYLASK